MNRFRNPMLRKQYDQMFHGFRTQHRDLRYYVARAGLVALAT